MDEDFDYSDPENELEDNFIELANGVGDSTEEFDENIFTDSEDDSFDDDDDRWTFDKEKPKSRFAHTMDSITSCSTIRRNDNLRLLDEKFEKVVDYIDNKKLNSQVSYFRCLLDMKKTKLVL